MSVTAGPAKRLLDAFCVLAQGETGVPPSGREAIPGWFAGERDKVDCAIHPGRFDVDGLRNYRVRPPSVRVTGMGVASAKETGEPGVLLDLRLAAAVVSNEGTLETHGDRARRLALTV